ncbi:MAG: PQQ-binding-like beta-propeller repeat protein, partial [bacterium]
MNLDTGAELWRVNLPFDQIKDVPPDPELDNFLFPRSWLPEVSTDWTAWIFGVSNGRLYASRSGNGGSVASPLYCIDSATGAILWSTAGTGPGDPNRSMIHAGTWSGGLFAPNGDPIVVSPRYIDRYDAQTGARLWRTLRVANVWEYGGGAINGNALYVADLVGAGNRVKRFNLSTGAFEYQGPPMTGGNLENGPFIGLDGS